MVRLILEVKLVLGHSFLVGMIARLRTVNVGILSFASPIKLSTASVAYLGLHAFMCSGATPHLVGLG